MMVVADACTLQLQWGKICQDPVHFHTAKRTVVNSELDGIWWQRRCVRSMCEHVQACARTCGSADATAPRCACALSPRTSTVTDTSCSTRTLLSASSSLAPHTLYFIYAVQGS